jgi:hypothetical protein
LRQYQSNQAARSQPDLLALKFKVMLFERLGKQHKTYCATSLPQLGLRAERHAYIHCARPRLQLKNHRLGGLLTIRKRCVARPHGRPLLFLTVP